jgi:hypothetical protein
MLHGFYLYKVEMDSIEITTELNKINALHSSLNETNPMTYIIFLEAYRAKLTESQVEWLDNKIDKLTQKTSEMVDLSMSNIDIGVAMQPLLSKIDETGYLVTLSGANDKSTSFGTSNQINRDA